MSRLDSFFSRLSAQIAILNLISRTLPAELSGPVLELGLGNGRTFDHLRERFPGRRVIAFDRAARSHGPSTPDPENLIVGEIQETARKFVSMGAALVHADIGTGYPDKDAIILTWLPQLVADLLVPDGIAASGLPLEHPELEPMEIPPSVEKGRYFLYRKVG
jgi:hypothetical protein